MYLWIAAEEGPSHPKPEAIVFISTCFQQQYDWTLSFVLASVFWDAILSRQRVSSIKSDRIRPNDNGLVTTK